MAQWARIRAQVPMLEGAMLGCDVNSHVGLEVQAERQALWQGQNQGQAA